MPHKTRLIRDLLRRLYLSGPHTQRREARSLPQRHLLPLLLSISILGGGALSCGGDTATNPALPGQTYWTLNLNQHAVNMATVPPYNTIQLTTTALKVDGALLSGVGPVTYTAADSTVTVSQTGLVTARYRTSGTVVTASLQVQNVTLSDEVIIQITDTAPQHPLTTFSLQPVSGDSAKRALDFSTLADGDFPWPVHAADAVGATLCDTTQCALKVFYTSSNREVATIKNSIRIEPHDTGHVVITATTWAYGVTMRDSVIFTVGRKLRPNIEITLAVLIGVLTLGFAAPKKLLLGVGAVVTFCNESTHPVDIIFDQPAAVDSASCSNSVGSLPPTGSGNIPAFGGGVTVDSVTGDSTHNSFDPINYACRRFSVPGTYHYHSSLFPSDTYEIQIKPD